MNKTPVFNPQDLSPEVLHKALEPLSDQFIPKRRFRVSEMVLGEGGFGTVKLAELWSGSWLQVLETPVKVAVKELRTGRFAGEELRMAFRLAREMRLWASCNHKSILKFTGYYLSNDFRQAYLISPYMENGNIREYLAREAPSPELRLKLVFDTIQGLSYLHTRNPPIVHGDLKPLNVLVNSKGKALLSDFGLAKALAPAPTGLSTSDGFKGTLRYCSPEVLQGSPRDQESDMWAWGCLALEIITNNPPYHEYQSETQVLLLICGREDSRITPEPSNISSIPLKVLQLLRECWSFEPNQRPNTERCLEELEIVVQLLPFDLPVPLFIPQRRLRLHDTWRISGRWYARLDPPKVPNSLIVRRTRVPSRDHFTQLAKSVNRLLTLAHENLAGIVGYSMNPNSSIIYLVWPQIEGKTLDDHIRRNQPAPKLERGVKLLQDILRGLEYLHSSAINVVHGTLDPWTVLVHDDGGRAVISEICLDCNQRRRELMQSFKLSFPLYWSSPEVLGIGYGILTPDGTWSVGWEISGKSDIWSWACLVLQVICGLYPWQGRLGPFVMTESFSLERRFTMMLTPEPEPEPILPSRLLALVRKCWNHRPEDRPSATECLDTIDLLIQEGLEPATSDSNGIQASTQSQSWLQGWLSIFSEQG